MRDLLPNCIKFPYSDGSYGSLIPFDKEILANQCLMDKMSNWRNLNLKYFLDQNPSTPTSTKTYVKKVLANKSHQMYLMADVNNEVFGHIGFRMISKEVAELDNLLRGDGHVPSDFVESAERALVQHIFLKPEVTTIQLKVLGSNVLAKRIHVNLGFKVSDVKPCFRTEDFRLREIREEQDEKIIVGYIVTMDLQKN